MATKLQIAIDKCRETLRDGNWHDFEELKTVATTVGLISARGGRLRASLTTLVSAGTLESRKVGRMLQFRGSQGSKVSGKCQYVGCYEPADCKHGFCKDHCHRHSVGSYSDRKYPRSMEPHIGVEIEVVYPTADAFRRGVGIDCHRDGSLGSYGAEYKVMAKSTAVAAEAAELVEQLWKRRARVNRSCGLHVHIDVRQLTEPRQKELLDWAERTQETWFALMPPSRRTSTYAQRLNEYNRRVHFAWAHLTAYNTIEVRIHGGTLNPYKIAGWLTALIHVQNKAGDPGYAFPDTGDAEADFWALFQDCPEAGREYLATRKANGGTLRDAAFAHLEE